MGNPREKRQLVQFLIAAMFQLTSHRYQIALDDLDNLSLRELQRFVRDLEYERLAAAKRTRLMPWRR